jgi:hypothetical protein
MLPTSFRNARKVSPFLARGPLWTRLTTVQRMLKLLEKPQKTQKKWRETQTGFHSFREIREICSWIQSLHVNHFFGDTPAFQNAGPVFFSKSQQNVKKLAL